MSRRCRRVAKESEGVSCKYVQSRPANDASGRTSEPPNFWKSIVASVLRGATNEEGIPSDLLKRKSIDNDGVDSCAAGWVFVRSREVGVTVEKSEEE